MNRIILIGNGFDLAHGLKASYRDFINDYWKTFIEKARDNCKSYEDENFKISTDSASYDLSEIISEKTKSLRDLKVDVSRIFTTTRIDIKNQFLEQISNHVVDKNWVDIENEYYELLKKCNHYEAEKLNQEFAQIEKLLEEYLTRAEKEFNLNQDIHDAISGNIYSLVDANDLSISYENLFVNEIEDRIQAVANMDKTLFAANYDEKKKIYEAVSSNRVHIENFVRKYLDLPESNRYEYLVDEVYKGKIPDYFLVPNDILFLNFNYTDTAYYYQPEDISTFTTIHIHGELNNEDNPIIFGYGDELAADYKKLEELNDDEYLKNVKSIRYLDTDNYRRLLSFVESEPYQVFIMGHSCGVSDRTLLNTLFEHKNCVSIKPFYHEREDGTDNYSEIVRNISRNFTNKATLRERVVNKTYCESLS